MKNVSGTMLFETAPAIISYGSVVGRKEAQGPLRADFDRIVYDTYAGMSTFEQAESALVREATEEAMKKGKLRAGDIDIVFGGDLLNQCVASSFAMRDFSIPYAGLYGACSTMALELIMGAIAVESGAVRTAACVASSHYCTAERQYRTPLEYGSQRTPTAQWTVTGAGACILSDTPSKDAYPRIHAAKLGVIIDMGVTDQNNMGAAMAPANVK